MSMTLGPGYNEIFEPMACNYIPGTCGGSIHAGPRGSDARGTSRNEEDPRLDTNLSGAALGYGLSNGRAYCQGANVTWHLQDATAAEGGCSVMIPGGHKARYKYPGGPHTDRSDASRTAAIDSEYARRVFVSAGDVCIFIDPGVPHGVSDCSDLLPLLCDGVI